jgi:hypothetical protein
MGVRVPLGRQKENKMKHWDKTPTKTDNPTIQMANRIKSAMDSDNKINPNFFEIVENIEDVEIELDDSDLET